jgi:hypothetical protein
MSPIMTPIPVERFLVAADPPSLPPGFQRSRQELTRGVPFQWTLEGDLDVVLFVPTGFAILWRDADPAAVASAGAAELAPHAAPRGADPHEQPAIRLLIRRARATVASIPLAAGLARITPDGDGARSALELFVTVWVLHAGCVRGPGDYGSFIDLGWRRADRGSSAFGVPGPVYRPRGGYLP